MQEVAVISTAPVDYATAARIEAAEARAWEDLYAASPANWAGATGQATRRVDGTLVLSWPATGRRYFSRAIGLGVIRPATERAIDDILGGYERAGIDMFLVQSLPHCRPAEYEDWLADRGLEPFDRQDRIVRGDRPAVTLDPAPGRTITVERVTSGTAREWARFVDSTYRLDTGPWLPCLIGRRGWHQYLAREDGAIVACRGMYIGPDGIAWLGMDGPVPGLQTQDFEPDAALCEAILRDGLALGVRTFVSDIEAPSPDMDTRAYGYFGRLGFTRPYTRVHHARV
jgi:hypothetical protein